MPSSRNQFHQKKVNELKINTAMRIEHGRKLKPYLKKQDSNLQKRQN